MLYLNLFDPKFKLLSRKRFLNVFYLADWKHALLYNEAVFTKMLWEHRPHGAHSDLAAYFYDMLITNKRGFTAGTSEQKALEFAVEKTCGLTDSSLILLVKSTYPMMTSNCWDVLDIKASSDAYKVYLQSSNIKHEIGNE